MEVTTTPISIIPGPKPPIEDKENFPNVSVEVRMSPQCTLTLSRLRSEVETYLTKLPEQFVPSMLLDLKDSQNLSKSVESINLLMNNSKSSDIFIETQKILLSKANLKIQIYRLRTGDEADPFHEMIKVNDETICCGLRWALPSIHFEEIWNNLIFEENLKQDLLNYLHGSLVFSEGKVNPNIISWNRMILLHGPPGTGKTSLCKALANKMAIRLYEKYKATHFFEISSENLMSKWFSESPRFVAQMFNQVEEYLENEKNLVFLLIDEVESLATTRNKSISNNDPSDAVRVVNAFLTHIDRIKRYSNVLIMATSNIIDLLDNALIDRADLKIHIDSPTVPALYSILSSCINELLRAEIIENSNCYPLLTYKNLMSMKFIKEPITENSLLLLDVCRVGHGLNGRTMRKIPLLCYSLYYRKYEDHSKDKLVCFIMALKEAVIAKKNENPLIKLNNE